MTYTVRMYSIVKRLRKRGLRKHVNNIQTDQGSIGDFTLVLCGDGAELKLSSDEGSRQEPIIPVLFDAKHHHDAFRQNAFQGNRARGGWR